MKEVEELVQSGPIRPSIQQLRSALGMMKSLAGEKGALLKEMRDLGRAIQVMLARERSNQNRIRQVRAIRKVMEEHYIGEENVAPLLNGGKDTREGQGSPRKRSAYDQADESRSKRRRIKRA
ncbi:hypothetical protein OH76DRAFT_543434 [Lentinus brumalis]|uniref:Uncharacterized protein n=1 Tax=Lentinus brumalis TaxID=2498619 RepID=A0A371D9S4_9APHY|nr:hypothetical protein OH76DRAFT_543434 [Polyporus brumalis]